MFKTKKEIFSSEQMELFVSECISMRELKVKLGYSPSTGSVESRIKEYLQENGISTEHFQGQSHKKNKGVYKTSIEEYLSNEVETKSYRLKKRLIDEEVLPCECNSCKLKEWLGKPIPLELHHKDGNPKNNELKNLELLCPNCHSFTDNFRNKKRDIK